MGLALSILGALVYLAVAVVEWALGSTYHTALALGLAVLIGLSARRGRVTVGAVLLLLVLTAYGVYRAYAGMHLLGP